LIAIVDYGAGNLRSVSKALDRLGAANVVTDDPRRVEAADRLILPGVGAFGACVAGVRERGFEEAVRAFIDSGRPFLGICVGLQILVETSSESPESQGLGLIRGDCPRFDSGLKVPHMGWNEVRRTQAPSRLFAGAPPDARFYFVHSYYIRPIGEDAQFVTAECDYGARFAAAFERDNLMAVQFHPEKSQRWGLKLLANFASL
jgi:glutamine amidotransferase